MANPDDFISLREFARRVNVNPNAITKAINSGRLTRREDDKLLHWPSQSKAWEEFRDPSKVRSSRPVFDEEEEEEEELSKSGEFLRAKIRKEVAVAGLKELELQIARGEMVNAAHVQSAMAEFAISTRDAIMTIPDRIASELAAELLSRYGMAVDLDVASELVHKVFRRESFAVLKNLADTIDKRGEL